MNLKLRSVLLGVVVVGALMQTVQPDRSNPEVTGEVQAPPEVMGVLRQSCYDCHSNETRWPWYSYIAPASWFLAEHVKDGRKQVNFSEWNTWDPNKKAHASEEILEVLESGEMPLKSYLLLHSDAELSEKDKMLLRQWAAEGEAR